MSEQPAAPSGGGGKILGMRPVVFYLAVGGTAVAAGLFYYWQKNRKAQAAAATAATSTASTTGSVDYSGELSVLQTELEALLAQQGQGTTTTTTTPPPATTGTGPPVVMSLPDGSGGWEQVQFPNQAAVDAWTAWNQAFYNDNHAQAYRSQWNQELTKLGVVRTDGQPLSPPSTKTGNPYDAL